MSNAPPRSRRRAFRLRPHEDRLLEAAAEAERVTVSEIVREAALRRARRTLTEPEARQD